MRLKGLGDHKWKVSAPEVLARQNAGKFTCVKSFLIVVGLIAALVILYTLVSFLTGFLWVIIKLLVAVGILYAVVQAFVKK